MKRNFNYPDRYYPYTMVAIILQRLCQEEALKDFKISDLLPPIFSEVYFEYLVMCRRGHEQIHEFFFLYGIPSIFRSLHTTKIFRFMNMSHYAATPSIILNHNWSHLFNGIVSPIISPQSSYA